MRCDIDGVGWLTNERPASRRGEPVLVLTTDPGAAHGPDEIVRAHGGRALAWVLVDRWLRLTRPRGPGAWLAESFVGLRPEADQLIARARRKAHPAG